MERNLEEEDKLPEDEADRETQREIEVEVKKWGRIACILGLALAVSIGFWIPFFSGQPLHRLWQTWGRLLGVTFMCLFFPCLFAAATTLNLWLYGARLRKIDRDFANGNWKKYDR